MSRTKGKNDRRQDNWSSPNYIDELDEIFDFMEE